MSVVVGCESCGVFKQVSAERASSRCSCGGARSLVMTSEQNQERWRRGISLDEWLNAPRAPATRASCESRRMRPCPHLRCKHHQGRPGQGGCDLDVGDDGPQPYSRIAELLGVSSSEAPRAIVENVRRRHLNVLPNVPEDDEAA